MQVLRRPVDNIVQLGSFGLMAVVLAVVRHDLVGFALAAPLAVLAVRAGRSGVFVSDDRVVVRNTFTTHEVARDDILRVDLATAGRMPLPAIVIRRRDAEPIPLWCVMPAGRGKRGKEALVPLLATVQRTLGLLDET